MLKTIRVSLATIIFLFMVSSCANAKESLRDQRKAFLKENREYNIDVGNQDYSEADRKFFSTLLQMQIDLVGAYSKAQDLKTKPEYISANRRDANARAEQTLARLAEYDGYAFSPGRVFHKESSLTLTAYSVLINNAAAVNDCDTAKAWFGDMRKIADSDYFIVKPDIEITFDRKTDREFYEHFKLNDLYDAPFTIDPGHHCFGENPTSVFASYRDAQLINDLDIYIHAFIPAKRGEFGLAREYLGNLKTAMDKFKGHRFASGIECREESSLMLMYLAASMLIADAEKNCETARDDYSAFKTLAGTDFLIIDPYMNNVFDAQADADIYPAQKEKILKQIIELDSYLYLMDGFPIRLFKWLKLNDPKEGNYNCFAKDEVNALAQE